MTNEVSKRLLLACPTYGYVDPTLTRGVRIAMMVAAKHGVKWVGDMSPDRLGYSAARNSVAQAALECDDADGIMWIDSDMDVPPGAIWKLILDAEKYEAEFMTGVYYQRLDPHDALMYKFNEQTKKYASVIDYPENMIVEIDGSGFGFCYTSRKLIAAIAALPDFNARAGWFPDTRDMDGGFGEDFNFAGQARKTGIKLYATTGVQLGHAGGPQIVTVKEHNAYLAAKAAKTTPEQSNEKETIVSAETNDSNYDFYRCFSCGRLMTKLQEVSRKANLNAGKSGGMCPCNSFKYRPSFPVGFEWIKPSVIWFSILRALGKA